MAQKNSQTQRHELLDKPDVYQVCFKFPQLAPVTQDQLA